MKAIPLIPADGMELQQYIVFCSERSEGPQCNGDYVWLVEAGTAPSLNQMITEGFVHPGNCNNVSQAGCVNCSGSNIVSFRVEAFSLERAGDLGLAVQAFTRLAAQEK